MTINNQHKQINKIIAVFSTAMIMFSCPANVSAEYVSSPQNFLRPKLITYESDDKFGDFGKDHLNDILITAYAERGKSGDVQTLVDNNKITETTQDQLNTKIGDSLVDARYDLDETSNHNYENLWNNLKDVDESEKKKDKEDFLNTIDTYNSKLKTTEYRQNNLVIVDLFDITLYCSNKSYEKNYDYYLSDDDSNYLKVTLSYTKGVKPIVLHKYFDNGFKEEYTKKRLGEWFVVPYGAVSSDDNYTKTITIKFNCLCAIAFLIPSTGSSSGNGTSGAVTSKNKGTGVASTTKTGSNSTAATGTGDDATTTDNNDSTDGDNTTDKGSSKEDNTQDCCDDWICKNLFRYKCCYWLCYNDKCWCWVLVIIIIIFLLILIYLIYKQIHDRKKRKQLEEESDEDEYL